MHPLTPNSSFRSQKPCFSHNPSRQPLLVITTDYDLDIHNHLDSPLPDADSIFYMSPVTTDLPPPSPSPLSPLLYPFPRTFHKEQSSKDVSSHVPHSPQLPLAPPTHTTSFGSRLNTNPNVALPRPRSSTLQTHTPPSTPPRHTDSLSGSIPIPIPIPVSSRSSDQERFGPSLADRFEDDLDAPLPCSFKHISSSLASPCSAHHRIASFEEEEEDTNYVERSHPSPCDGPYSSPRSNPDPFPAHKSRKHAHGPYRY